MADTTMLDKYLPPSVFVVVLHSIACHSIPPPHLECVHRLKSPASTPLTSNCTLDHKMLALPLLSKPSRLLPLSSCSPGTSSALWSVVPEVLLPHNRLIAAVIVTVAAAAAALATTSSSNDSASPSAAAWRHLVLPRGVHLIFVGHSSQRHCCFSLT